MEGLTIKQAADIIGVSKKTISNYCKNGLLRYYKGQKNIIYINEEDVGKYKPNYRLIGDAEKLIEARKKDIDEELKRINELESQIRGCLVVENKYGSNSMKVVELIECMAKAGVVELGQRELFVLRSFIEGHGYVEIASKLELSGERVRQIIDKSFDKLCDVTSTHGKWLHYTELEKENELLRAQIKSLREKYEISISDQELKYITTLLSIRIADLSVSVRTINALHSGNSNGEKVDTLDELLKHSEIELLKFRNFGRKSLSEIRDILDGLGLDFRLPGESDMSFYQRMIELKNKEV